jgi:nucleoside-diphosphate-sugar epimerase
VCSSDLPIKLLDTSKINKLGWFPKISLREGILRTVGEYIESIG